MDIRDFTSRQALCVRSRQEAATVCDHNSSGIQAPRKKESINANIAPSQLKLQSSASATFHELQELDEEGILYSFPHPTTSPRLAMSQDP